MSCCREWRRTGTWVSHPEAGDGRASQGTGTKAGLMPSRDGHHNPSCCLKTRDKTTATHHHTPCAGAFTPKKTPPASWLESKQGLWQDKNSKSKQWVIYTKGRADAQGGFASPGEAPLDINNDEEQSSCSASLQSI